MRVTLKYKLRILVMPLFLVLVLNNCTGCSTSTIVKGRVEPYFIDRLTDSTFIAITRQSITELVEGGGLMASKFYTAPTWKFKIYFGNVGVEKLQYINKITTGESDLYVVGNDSQGQLEVIINESKVAFIYLGEDHNFIKLLDVKTEKMKTFKNINIKEYKEQFASFFAKGSLGRHPKINSFMEINTDQYAFQFGNSFYWRGGYLTARTRYFPDKFFSFNSSNKVVEKIESIEEEEGAISNLMYLNQEFVNLNYTVSDSSARFFFSGGSDTLNLRDAVAHDFNIVLQQQTDKTFKVKMYGFSKPKTYNFNINQNLEFSNLEEDSLFYSFNFTNFTIYNQNSESESQYEF